MQVKLEEFENNLKRQDLLKLDINHGVSVCL